MSESSPRSSDKSGGNSSTSTIGYRFHSKSEELGEVQEEPASDEQCTNSVSNLDIKPKGTLVSSGSLDAVKCDYDKKELHGEMVKDYWGLLGRSISVDSSYQSPFSNPLETWKKLNELKGKITKTVEKISEMKIDHNVSSHFKLNSSKENSSISDSEDNSEASKVSEQWKDAEDLNLSLKEVINKTTDMLTNTLDVALQNAKSEIEAETELRHRKSHTKFSNMMKISDIKIATAKSEPDDSLTDDNVTEDIESGVEAEENLDSTSLDAFGDPSLQQIPVGGSQTPPGGSDIDSGYLGYVFALTFSEVYAVAFLVGWGLYFFLPMSDFSRGFLFCLLFMFILLKLKSYILKDDSLYVQQGTFVMPDFSSLPPLKVPEYTPVKGVWINEYEREIYDPDYYSVSQTVPAYLELDNSILKLSRPKGKINKRATYDEPEYKLQFLHQRVYNISGCNVFLLPEGLTRKRLFSKKYPIVIFLRPNSFIGEKNMEESSESVEGDDLNLSSPSSTEKKPSLYLFTRCDRQKEEWYRKLLAATRLSQTSKEEEKSFLDSEEKRKNNHEGVGNGKERDSPKKHIEEHVNVAETSTPFENVFFDPEVAQIEEYMQYMGKFVEVEPHPVEPKRLKSRELNAVHKKQKKKKGADLEGPGHEESCERVNSLTNDKKSKGGRYSKSKIQDEPETEEPTPAKPAGSQIQWFSAFINRILFDIFRSPYWLAKIHEKLYKKLNSIRLPYYVEDIEVIEMDLGKTGPMFHRVSHPYLDERGLWFDMDTTFDGLIKLTIQTHLNLVKLQKGMQEEETLKHVLEKPEKPKKKAKEIKDPLLIKDSHEKSKKTVSPTKSNKKLEKTDLRSKSSSVESHKSRENNLKPENVESEANLEVENFSEMTLYKEVARMAKIALEEGIDDVSQKEFHDEPDFSDSDLHKERRKSKSPIYDSEVEDSAESSDEDVEVEEEEITQIQVPPEAEDHPPAVSVVRRYPKNRRSSKKLFRMFENVAQSKYFKSVAQSKYVQKAIAGVSATKLKLTLEIKSVSGTLTINIPPPPSDRFWYGFRDMPKLVFSANPKIGEKAVRFSQIKNYLQRKILHEIKKAMVLPNMIDFVLPSSTPARSLSSQQMEETTTATPTTENTTSDLELTSTE